MSGEPSAEERIADIRDHFRRHDSIHVGYPCPACAVAEPMLAALDAATARIAALEAENKRLNDETVLN